MPDAAAEKARPNRMSRQRQRTHDRLVDAALTVMAQKGADATTITDITEAADVGFGSFYNHFSSKDEILNVATDELFERIGGRLDQAIATMSDPLEALTTAVRLFICMILPKPVWAQFIFRVCIVPGYKHDGLFSRLFRDIKAVEDAHRASMVDPAAAPYAVGGALLFMIIALLEGDLPIEGAPERISAVALRILGVDEAEIARLVQIPLPAMEDEDEG